jgi:hypothetical protein
MKKFKISLVLVFFFMMAIAFSVGAQPPDPPDPGDNPVPITGIEYLLIAGGAMGGYKLFKRKADLNK